VTAEKLSNEQVQSQLSGLNGWTLNDKGELFKVFKQLNFLQGLGFVTRVTILAEKAGHHPDILLTYPSVQIMLTTHDAGGLTDADFNLAREIDALA